MDAAGAPSSFRLKAQTGGLFFNDTPTPLKVIMTCNIQSIDFCLEERVPLNEGSIRLPDKHKTKLCLLHICATIIILTNIFLFAEKQHFGTVSCQHSAIFAIITLAFGLRAASESGNVSLCLLVVCSIYWS